MKDNEEVADSTSDEISFTTPADIGQVNGTVFNLYDSSSNPKEQGYRNNFLFNVKNLAIFLQFCKMCRIKHYFIILSSH